MSAASEPRQTTRVLENGGFWIEGEFGAPPPGVTGPLVMGPDWLLEMLRPQDGECSYGFFWSPFAIVRDFPIVNVPKGQFVGFSLPTPPPASWLTTSMVFNLGTAALVRTPDEFIAMLGTPLPYVPMEPASRVSALSEKAKRFIASRYRANVGIHDVARALGVSHAHLTRGFKRDFGLTPVSYRHRLRVSEAMGRLSQGERIVDVGYEVGFNDTTRFYKDFRKVTGTSPGKCRRSMN
jgi:AraC-like DNA-binding protein